MDNDIGTPIVKVSTYVERDSEVKMDECSEHVTDPIDVVRIVALLRCPLRQHFEVDELHLTHVPVGIIVEKEVYHTIRPSGRRWFVEAVLDATHCHLVSIKLLLFSLSS